MLEIVNYGIHMQVVATICQPNNMTSYVVFSVLKKEEAYKIKEILATCFK
jgi:hypothetical protein